MYWNIKIIYFAIESFYLESDGIILRLQYDI